MDLFKPIFYAFEKQAVGRNIPDVSSIKDRWTLQKVILEDGDDSTSDNGDSSFDHSLWDQVLKRHVYTDCEIGSISQCHAVDYQGIAKDESFQQYLDQLAAAVNIAALSRREQLALWINAYNALCIRLIVQADQQRQGSDAPLLESITQLSNNKKKNDDDDNTDGGDGPVWDQVAGTVGGIAISLNGIEHVQLRAQWDEPSLHACIVCASASCPNLRREAFVGSRLQDQMKSQMKEWLSHPQKGLSLRQDQLWLSRIFLWFGDDFGNNTSGISSFPFFGNVAGEKQFRAWLAQFVSEHDKALATRIEYSNDGFRYFDYDWKLNRWTTKKNRHEGGDG